VFGSLALMEMKLTLCALLKKYQLNFGDSASRHLVPYQPLVLTPKSGKFMVRVQHRVVKS